MPKKLSPKRKNSSAKSSAQSPGEYTYTVEEVAVQYRHGEPIQIVHPPHLTCLQNPITTPAKKGGRPSTEKKIRHILRCTLTEYLAYFGVPKPPPSPLTRYGLTTMALTWCQKERGMIEASSAPKRVKERDLVQLSASRDTIKKFLQPFFPQKGEPVSVQALHRILLSL